MHGSNNARTKPAVAWIALTLIVVSLFGAFADTPVYSAG